MKNLIENRKRFAVVVALFLLVAAIAVVVLRNETEFEYSGQLYRPGEAFMDADGCNTCSFNNRGELQCTLMACDVEPPIDGQMPSDEVIDIDFSYSEGGYSYVSTIQKPTPCHVVTTEVVIRERFPEDVDLKFYIVDSGDICIQVIGEEQVTGEIAVSEVATINVFVNDRRIPSQSLER